MLPTFHQPSLSWRHTEELQLADPDFLRPRPIDIIVGADSYGQIIKPNIIQASASEPIAQLSIFGWLIHGPVNTSKMHQSAALRATVQNDEKSLQDALTKFWLQEEIPSDSSAAISPEDQQCETHFRDTHSRDASGRYIVRLPLKMSTSLLGDSYMTAHHCLQRTLCRLGKNSNYRQLYTEFMTEYEQLSHMQRPAPKDSSTRKYYLPHHGVFRPEKETTQLRVVFNGSSPTSTGYSINDLMHTGPNLYLELSDVLTWIRHHRHIFSTDITKMYRQIRIHEDDWDLQRILWIDDEQNEVPFQLTTVTYGTKAAPYLATRTLLQLAEDEGSKYPLALPVFKYGRYVDDLFGGADSPAELIGIAHQLTGLCDAGRFPLAKWHSNTPEFLNEVSAAAHANSSISFDDCETKILGIKWTPQEDKFRFSSKPQACSEKLTKRLILSEVAQIYDPLGFISPVVIRAKMLLQELWLHKIGWDEPLPSNVSSKWLTIREDFIRLASLSIPRWFNTLKNSSVQLHGFSDASQLALSAVVYLVVKSSSTGAKVSLVCSKTKVAPLKQVTIPRLELTAALLLAKLMRRVQATMQLDVESTHMWTDSQVTLKWVSTHASRWKDFVRNRVTQIQELSQHAQWRHVPGKANPADCASRGLTTAQLENHHLWWTGPPWLTQDQDSWPTQPSLPDDCFLEARPGISLIASSPRAECHWDLIKRYSSVTKLFRITALCYRVISRWRGKSESTPVSIVPAADMERAKQLWIKSTQAAYFGSEIKQLIAGSPLPPSHPFSRLTAFIDQEGIIRVGGRLDQSDLSYESKHPAILPRHSHLSALIIDHAHKSSLHGGTQLTLAHTRQSYWIIGGRAPVKSHVLRCVKCARQRGIRAQQLMGQLPLSRVSPARPFTNTGLDYAGPITLKAWRGRGSKTHKGWICAFVCFATSAVHLEAVTDYSTDGFLAAYRRFTARRGIPRTLTSDCGTNFVGADVALKKLFTQSSRDHHTVASALSQDRTQWNFNPPAAPHMGGKWEAVVKSTKYHLRRTVGETLLTHEEFSTLLAQIEAVLNSRPLEPLSDDPDDLVALTPAHFLTGDAISTVPEPSLQNTNLSRLSNWQLIQQRVQSFWYRWSTQYLQRHQAISKWHHPSNDIKEGSLVLLTDERLPPCKWPLARVIALHPGKDQLTRVVTIKTATTTLVRPITKLAILPVPATDSTTDPQSS